MKEIQVFARWGLACVMVWLILCAAIGILSVEGGLHPRRIHLTESDEESAQAIAVQDRAPISDVEIAADDGAILRAWALRPQIANGNAVILFHGQGDNRDGMLGNADMLLRHGFSVVLPDARAHGESGGPIATYGVKEAGDVRRWYEWIERTQAPHCIDGLGDSMGAAILLDSLAAETGFCAVSAESAFSTFQEAVYDRLGQQFGTGPWVGRTLLRPPWKPGCSTRACDTGWISNRPLRRARCDEQGSSTADSRLGGHESSATPLRTDQGGELRCGALGTCRRGTLWRGGCGAC